jgi:DNA-binding NarL/FixJ family response regulator
LLVLSVHDDPTLAGLVLDAGAAGVVLKRTAATDLIPAVEAALRGGSYVSPALAGRAVRGDGEEVRP